MRTVDLLKISVRVAPAPIRGRKRTPCGPACTPAAGRLVGHGNRWSTGVEAGGRNGCHDRL